MAPCKYCGLVEDRGAGVPATYPSNDTTSPPTGDLRRDLEELESQIAQVEASLEHLRSKAMVLKKRINQHFAPVLRLPPEVTAKIFEDCIPQIFWCTEDPTLHSKIMPNASIPLVIGKVCRAWRHQAWSTPKLWSSISLLLDRRTPVDCELLKEWILRSGRSPLSIHLRLDRTMTTARNVIQCILSMVAECCERWRDVYLALPLSLYSNFDFISDRLPLLTTLCLDLGMEDRGRQLQHFSTAPQLRHVEIFRYHPALVNIAFGQVTHLSLSFVGIEHCIDVLSCAPIHSHYSFLNICSRNENHPLPLLIAPVGSLELGMYNTPSFIRFLDSLSLPAVQALRIDAMWCGLPRSSLISLVSRSGCSLQRFGLIKCRCSSSELRAFFQAIPSLVELEVNRSTISDGGLFQLLGVSENDSDTMLPNLRALKLVDQNDPDISELATMILSRWRNTSDGVAQFSSVQVRINQWQDSHPQIRIVVKEEMHSLLRQLIAEGLEISIKDKDKVIL